MGKSPKQSEFTKNNMSLPKIHKEKRDTDRKKTISIFLFMVLTELVTCGKIRIRGNE